MPILKEDDFFNYYTDAFVSASRKMILSARGFEQVSNDNVGRERVAIRFNYSTF